jgi:hypothetical protein
MCFVASSKTRATLKSMSASTHASRARPCWWLTGFGWRRDKNVELVANDLLIIRYKPIRRFVEEESVLLV